MAEDSGYDHHFSERPLNPSKESYDRKQESQAVDLQEDYPDPWPKPGWMNNEWAAFILNVVLPLKDKESSLGDIVDPLSYESKLNFLKRALDIACMHSIRPKDRFIDDLIEKLGRASCYLESDRGKGEFTDSCRELIQRVVSYNQ